MSRKKGSKGSDVRKIEKLGSLIVQETPDDERLFLEALESLDPKAVKEKLAQAAASADPLVERSLNAASKSSTPAERVGTVQLDLHGLHLDDAKLEIDRVLTEIVRTRRGETRILVITGKGRHSGPGGPVLARKIHDYVRLRWAKHIVSLEESPADAIVGGLPVRGHFNVIVRS